MARKYLVPIDLNKNELQNARIQNLASAPASPVVGQIYFNTTDNDLYVWDGTAWVLSSGTTVSYGAVTAVTTFGASSTNGVATTVARSDHSHGSPALSYGTVTAVTTFGASSANGSATTLARSDHSHGSPVHDNTAHSGISLSALAVPTSAVSLNGQKITNLAEPTASTDAASKSYVDTVAQGLNIHDAVLVATTANLSATYTAGSAGADGGTGVGATLTMSATGVLTIDGVALSAGDRVLVKNQTTALQNGVYTLTTAGAVGVAGILTRATDSNNSIAGQVVAGDFVFVDQGSTYSNQQWAQTETGTSTTPPRGIKLGTDSLAYTQIGGSISYTASSGIILTGTNFTLDTSVAARKYATTLSTSATSYTVTHNLGTLDVIVQVYTVADGSEVIVDNLRATTNTITLQFATAPTANAYRVVVLG